MLTEQEDGDCNGCHTAEGELETAPEMGDPYHTPGRIFLP
jgi:hypothetical protein